MNPHGTRNSAGGGEAGNAADPQDKRQAGRPGKGGTVQENGRDRPGTDRQRAARNGGVCIGLPPVPHDRHGDRAGEQDQQAGSESGDHAPRAGRQREDEGGLAPGEAQRRQQQRRGRRFGHAGVCGQVS